VTVSVVVAAHDAERTIGRCLDALVRQPGLDDAEVIVASSSTDGTDSIVQRFPFVRHLRFPGPLNVAELRGRAIAEAKGAVIAVLDPYSIVGEGWLAALRRAHEERPELVVGGPVDLADAERRGLLEWALYINEYGMFLPPMDSGPRDLLAGSNVSYKRAALFDGALPRYPTFWKTLANQDAGPLWLAAGAVVALDKPVPFGDFLRTRYHHGRCFAGMRRVGRGERILRALTAPLLPAVFLWRWGSAYLGRGRNRSKLFATAPLQVLLFGTWALGELVGYLRGPGRSCRRLFY
jgi:glycosyltransferase involved in cell wall biosynthesis